VNGFIKITNKQWMEFPLQMDALLDPKVLILTLNTNAAILQVAVSNLEVWGAFREGISGFRRIHMM
jgi:hypothetical protein